MQVKDYLLDNGLKSRKFLLILIAIIAITGLSVLWANMLWNIAIFNTVVDNLTTLVLGYCGISATRAAIPTASIAVAKVITTKNTQQQQSIINPKENLAGSKELL
jgi:cytochrome b subunit of formate dehydrogenase